LHNINLDMRDGDFVVGIVARMQRHRRFELFFEALVRASREIPSLKVLLVGRGTWMEEVAVKPTERTELAGRAVFTGYRRGAEYVATLRCMDVKVYLTPGSEAARAGDGDGRPLVRPAATLGRTASPASVNDDPDEAGAALVRLHSDPALRRSMARRHPRPQARSPGRRRVASAIYEEILGVARTIHEVRPSPQAFTCWGPTLRVPPCGRLRGSRPGRCVVTRTCLESA
jgi:glycosyltransferase involved in cell wall biosynthesis